MYTKGDDFLEKGADHKTYGIHVGEWGNKIVVYDDDDMRNKILNLLNKEKEP